MKIKDTRGRSIPLLDATPALAVQPIHLTPLAVDATEIAALQRTRSRGQFLARCNRSIHAGRLGAIIVRLDDFARDVVGRKLHPQDAGILVQ